MSAPKQKTAIEWLMELMEKINHTGCGNTMIDIPKEFIEQAKAMEREQIKDAYNQGESDGYKQFIINIDKTYESFEQYYKETYETI